MPPGGAPEASWGVGGVNYTPVPWNCKVTATYKILGLKCKSKETRAKSSKIPPGGAPRRVGGVKYPPVPWNCKVTPTYKILGP